MIDRMKKDRLYQPKTLQSLESRVEEAKVEINSCLQTTLRDSKQTYKNSKVLLVSTRGVNIGTLEHSSQYFLRFVPQ